MNNYCVLYCRVSTKDEEEKGLSLDAQEDLLKEYASEESLSIVKTFRCSESAKEAGRKGFNEMLRYCQTNEILNLLVESYDRLHRNKEDEVKIEKFIKDGAFIHRVGERVVRSKDTDIEDETIDDMKFVFSRHERKKISKRVRYAISQKLKKGEPPFTPPVGYRSIKGNKEKGETNRIVKTKDADKVKQFLETFNTGKFSLAQMLEIAKDMNLKSQRENELIRKEDMARIIHSRFYYGEFECQGKLWEIKADGYEPIISRKMWQKNQDILEQRTKYKKPEKGLKFKYNNLIHCAKCGRLYYGFQPIYKVKWKKKDGSFGMKPYEYPMKYITDKSNSGKRERCIMPPFTEEEIEGLLLEEIEILKFDNKRWDEIKSKLFHDDSKEFLDFEIQNLRTELTQNETRKDKIYSDYEDGVVTGDFVQTRMLKLDDRQKEIKLRLAELEEDREQYDEKIGKSITIIDSIRNFKKKWGSMSVEKQNEMLRLMTTKIFATYNKIKLNGKMIEQKDLYIQWNDEFKELFDLGIIKATRHVKGSKVVFNCGKIRDG